MPKWTRCSRCKGKYERYSIFRSLPFRDGHFAAKECHHRCIACANEEGLFYNNPSFVGILTMTEHNQYIALVSSLSTIDKHGLVKMNFDALSPLGDAVCFALAPIREKKIARMEPLPDDFDSGFKHNRNRMWKQLYPVKDDNNVGKVTSWEESMKSVVRALECEVEKVIFPHEYFGRRAQRRFWATVTKVETIREEPVKDSVISLKNINILCRGCSLITKQTPHVDSKTSDILLIAPLKCSASGYRFEYVAGSHQLQELPEQQQPFPLELLSEVLVKASEMIFCYENTIHRGGSSSGGQNSIVTNHLIGTDDMIWLDQNEVPSDISIQFSFRNRIMPSDELRQGRAQPRWFYKTVRGDTNLKEMWNNQINESIEKFLHCRNEARKIYFRYLIHGRRISMRRKRKAYKSIRS